jgi:uncharacterized protein (DUF2141 family)
MSRKLVVALALGSLVLPVALGARQVPPPPPSPPAAPAGVLGSQIGAPRDPNQQRTRTVPVGNGAISGAVMAADTGRPLAKARVNLGGVATSASPAGQGASANAPTGAAGGRGGRGLNAPNAINVSGQNVMMVNGAQVNGVSLQRTLITDAQGNFSFDKVPAGEYTVSVSRDQYLATSYGQKKYNRPGSTIVLGDGQKISIKVPMQRGGVITGMITGEDGEPLINAQVRAMRYDTSSGFRRLQSNGYANTDDRGVYRMFGLQPGDYIVAATQNQSDITIDRMLGDIQTVEAAVAAANLQGGTPGQPVTVSVPITLLAPGEAPAGYAPTYYPSATSVAGAINVSVSAGEEKSGVDVSVQYVRAGNVQGSVAGMPQSGVVQITSVASDPALAGNGSPSTRVGQDGRFTLRNLAPGQYTLYAYTMPQQNFAMVNGMPIGPNGAPVVVGRGAQPSENDVPRLWGRAVVTVDGQSEQTPIVITLAPGKSIAGHVMFDTQVVPDLSRSRVIVSLQQAPAAQTMSIGPAPSATVGTDGHFSLDSVPPGRWILRASINQPGGQNTNPIVLKSSIVNGQDTLDIPLEFTGDQDLAGATLTFTDRMTELSGTLIDSSGKSMSEYTILAVSTDNRFWQPGSRRIQTTRASGDGHYTFRNIPPGDYMIAAVTDFESGTQYDPEFLKELAGASMRVTLTDGAKKTQDLRVAVR